MTQQNITAINVFIEIDGQQCIAPIKPESANIFMHMLPSFQGNEDPKAGANLSKLPPAAVDHLLATRRAIWEHANKSTPAPTASPYADEATSQAILDSGAKWRHQRLQQADMINTNQVAALRGVTRTRVDQWRKSGKCIGIPKRSLCGYVFPIWQFDPEIFPAIHPITKALGTKDGWTVLAFLENGQGALGGQSPRDALKSKSASQELIIELAIAESH